MSCLSFQAFGRRTIAEFPSVTGNSKDCLSDALRQFGPNCLRRAFGKILLPDPKATKPKNKGSNHELLQKREVA